MRARWHALHSQLLSSTNRLNFQTSFRTIRDRTACLAGLSDAAGLLDYMHRSGGDPEHRNDILGALVHEAQAGGVTGKAATTFVLLALWPGLDAVRGRLRRQVQDPADLASDIIARATLGIRCMDLARVNRIAATLVRNVERDILRDLQRQRHEGAGARAVEEILDADDGEPLFGRAGPDHDTERRILAGHLRSLIGDDVDLVMAVAVDGFSQREAADLLGITHDAARKRYQRALDRLRTGLPELL